MSYEIYKQFGRVISKEESDLIIAKVSASWWDKRLLNEKYSFISKNIQK